MPFEIDGKKYFSEDELKSLKGPGATPEATPTPAASPAEPAGGESLDEKVDDVAAKIMAKIDVGKLREDILGKVQADLDAKEKKVSALIDLEKLMKKDVGQMTAKEKIIGFFQAMVQANQPVLKALSEGTAADGGYLFPDEFRAEVIRDLEENPHMRNEVTVIPMTRDVMKIPTLVAGPKVTWTAENAAKTTTTTSFNEATLTVYKMAAIMYISDELVEDSTEIDVVQFIIKLFSEAIGTEEDRVITVGSGTGQPYGYATTGQSVATIACTATGLTFDDVINLEYSLPAKYHPNAKFYIHRNQIRDMRKIKDGNNRYLWEDRVAPTQPATFHGYPVVEDNNLAESVIYFGDLKKAYYLGDRKMMTVRVSQDTETAFTHDQTAIRVVARLAGRIVLHNALKGLTGIP